jgi:hypothetical protein
VKEFADFLGAQPPFDRLDAEDMDRLVRRVEVEYFTAGAVVVTDDEKRLEHLWVLRTGALAVLDRAVGRSTASIFTVVYCRRTSASHSARRPSLEPKWWVISPAETPARLAMVRKEASKPSSAKAAIAAFRSCARAVRSAGGRPSGAHAQHMTSTLYSRQPPDRDLGPNTSGWRQALLRRRSRPARSRRTTPRCAAGSRSWKGERQWLGQGAWARQSSRRSPSRTAPARARAMRISVTARPGR